MASPEWYQAELDATAEECTSLSRVLKTLADVRGPEVAAEALAEVLPDVADHLSRAHGAVQFLAKAEAEGAAEPTQAVERLVGHAAFLRSALEERTAEAQARRAQREQQHVEAMRVVARDFARELAVGLSVSRKGEGQDQERVDAAHAAAESLIEALPVLWVGRGVVRQRDAEHEPDAVVADVQVVLRWLGRWIVGA